MPATQSKVIHDPIEVIDELASMGLPLEILREAILAGEGMRNECTANDPASAGGFFSYARTTRALAELLIPLGWTRLDDNNLALIVSHDGAVAIVIATGDDGTGAHYRSVRSRYSAGPRKLIAIEQNKQLSLAGFDDDRDSDEPTARRLWFLLRNRVGDQIYAELSLPLATDGQNFIEAWAKRIILGHFPANDPPVERNRPQQDVGDDIVIDVHRK